MKRKNKPAFSGLLCLLLTFLCHDLYAQLPAFTLTVTASPQTCLGNGGLTFSTSGTTAGSQLDYVVYLLPNTTTPVTTVTNPAANGLVAGSYQVVATQTLGNNSNTATANAVIVNNVVPLAYTLETDPCNNGGTITVHVTSGNAVSYEVIAGPLTKPLQSSNVFSNMPLGLYTFRVHDNCGDAVVVTIQFEALPAYLFIQEKELPDVGLPDCNKITVAHTIGNNYPMSWPVTLTYTVHPPGGGAAVIVTKTVNNYPDDQIVFTDIPFYYNQYYSYELTMVDACGNQVTITSSVNEKFDFALSNESLSCNNYMLGIDMSVYKSPCTVTFLTSPSGFNPASCNASHPVFNADNILYGNNTNPVPLGDYKVKVTDACGHTATHDITITDQGTPLVDSGIGSISLCHGFFTIDMPFGRDIASAVITVAPVNYNGVLPQDVMQFANGSTLNLQDVPAGNYTVVLTDICGVEYTEQIEIVAGFGNHDLGCSILPGCSENEGSVYLYSFNYRLTSVLITAAPAAFGNALPYDGSMLIDQFGVFRTNSLPVGNYWITATDDCGNEIIYQFTITGYQVFDDTLEVVPGCGSFDVLLNYVSTNSVGFGETFWLQQYNEETGKWINPEFGYPYDEGDPLYFGNALQLDNNTTNYALPYSGKFRIMRYFSVYTSQDPDAPYNFLSDCIAVIYEFTYYNNPHIIGAYGFSCGDGTSDVILDAEGFAPLHYEITSMNGQPFALNNGTSNMFQGLENGTYNFRVTDGCGNFLNILYDITQLPSFTIQNLGFCAGQDGSITVPGFSFLTYEWWKEGAPGAILSTSSSLDIDDFDPAADNGTYIVHITASTPGSCIDQVLSAAITAQPLPDAGEDNEFSMCNDGQPIDLLQYLEDGYDVGGVWVDVNATGKLQEHTFITYGLTSGTYTFKYIVTNSCGETDEAVIAVTLKPSPQIPIVAIDGPVCEGSTILLSAGFISGAAYSWTGPDGFTSNDQNPIVPNASASSAGVYTLNITVAGFDCPSVPVTVIAVVNKIPEFTVDGDTVICQGNKASLLIVPQNFDAGLVEYAWYFNDVPIGFTDQNMVIDQAGVYKVVIDNNGCIAEKEITVTENNFTISLESGCVEDACIITMITDADLTNAEIVWSGPDNFSFTGNNPDITNLEKGDYTVMLTTAEGCSDTALITVENTYCGDITKGVSPNGDGLNDSFDLSNLDIAELEIFNRYGLIVYKAGNYKKEWHGQADSGKELPTGTYYYVITPVSGKQFTGWVYLQR